jgi:D-alanyl-D-alanine dipeptidase
MVFKAYDFNHKDWLGEYIHGRCVQEEKSGKACVIAEAYSGHNTGNAIDLTIAVDDKPLDMGSNFDEFTHRSHLYYYMDLIEYVKCKQKGLSMEECIEKITKMRKEQGLPADKKGSPFYDHIKSFYRDFADRSFSNDDIEQFKIFHQNRTILKNVMENVGLSPYIYEWWHYSDISKKYEVYWDCLNTLF